MDKPLALCYFNSMILTLSVLSCVKGALYGSIAAEFSGACLPLPCRKGHGDFLFLEE